MMRILVERNYTINYNPDLKVAVSAGDRTLRLQVLRITHFATTAN